MKKINRLSKKLASAEGLAILKNEIKTAYPLHWHEFYEIEYILSGRGSYVMEGAEYEIFPGCLFFSTAINFHEIRAMETIHTITIEFTEQWIEDALFAVLCRPAVLSEFDKKTVETLCAEFERKDEYRPLAMRLTLNQILLAVCRSFTGEPATRVESQAAKQALAYIQTHFREDLTLRQLAGKVGVSYHYMSKLFHIYTGVTFTEYLTALRLDYAAKLLRYSELPATEICFASGFNSYSNFSQKFYGRFQAQPGKYRSSK